MASVQLTINQSTPLICKHCETQYATLGEYPVEDQPDIINDCFTLGLECDNCISSPSFVGTFPPGMKIRCQRCLGDVTLSEILGEADSVEIPSSLVEIFTKITDNVFFCDSCANEKSEKKSEKPLMPTVQVAQRKKTPNSWICEVSGCTTAAATKTGSELKQSYDAFTISGTNYGVAIVDKEDVAKLSKSQEVYVSPVSKQGKAFVLIESLDVPLLQSFYKRMYSAESALREAMQMPQTNKIPYMEAVQSKKKNLYNQILDAGKKPEPVTPQEEAEEVVVEKKKKKRDREEQEEKEEDQEETKVSRTQTKGPAREFLQSWGMTAKFASTVLQSLSHGKGGGKNTYVPLATGRTVVRMSAPDVHHNIEAGLIQPNKVSPPFESRKTDIDAQEHTCLVLLDSNSPLLPSKEVFLGPHIGEDQVSNCLATIASSNGEFVTEHNDEIVLSVTRDFAAQITPTEYIRVGGPFVDNNYLVVIRNNSFDEESCFLDTYKQVKSGAEGLLKLLERPELK